MKINNNKRITSMYISPEYIDSLGDMIEYIDGKLHPDLTKKDRKRPAGTLTKIILWWRQEGEKIKKLLK